MNSKKISFDPVGDDLYNVIYPGRMSRYDENISGAELQKIIEREPYNFNARQDLATLLIEEGDLERACQIRFDGCMLALEALQEAEDDESDDTIEIAWDNSGGNRNFVSMIAASATDHYMFGDFEMAATLYETALMLDSEDHLDVSPPMLCSFAAIGEWEAYDIYKINLAPKSLVSQFVSAFADYMRLTGSERDKAMAAAVGNLADLAAELRATDHPADEHFLNDIESKRPSRNAQARALWFAHTPIWTSFPQFTDAIANG